MEPFFWAVLVSSMILCGHSAAGEITRVQLQAALNESNQLKYEEIYDQSLFHLDMEDVDNVTTKPSKLDDEILVVNSTNCSSSDILQTEGIPWSGDNSAMRFTSNDSFVNISGTSYLTKGWSASLWVKRFNKTTHNCGICTVMVNNDSFHLHKLASANHTSPDVYQLNFSNGIRFLKFQVQYDWDWNMISITINTTHICLYENGVNLQHSSEPPTAQENCETFTADVNGDDSLSMALNSPQAEGCTGLEVDEVAMWSRALYMSELMALRVKPFNTSCELNLDPDACDSSPCKNNGTCERNVAHYDCLCTNEMGGDNCVIDLTAEYKKFDSAQPEEASDQLDNITKQLTNGDKPRSPDEVLFMTKILDATASKGLLNDSSLSKEVQMTNRVSYVSIASTIFDSAEQSADVAEETNINELMSEIEKILSEVYFYSNITNETISTGLIDMMYIKFSPGQKHSDKVYDIPNTKITIQIPKENFKGDHQMVVMVYPKDMNALLIKDDPKKEPIATVMVSLQLPDTDDEILKSPIILSFSVEAETMNKAAEEETVTTCKFMDLDKSKWEVKGVKTTKDSQNATNVDCEVSHLTNFAVLLSSMPLEDDQTLSVLTYIFLTISIICLLITFVVLMCLREIGNTQRVKILKQFIFALMMAQMLFLFTTELFVHIPVLCKLLAAVSHYFWLAVFTWMLVQGVQLYTKVRSLVGGNIKQIFYILFAWGFPFPIALIPLYMNLTNDDILEICWLPPELIWFFAVPAILVFTVNLMVTVMVMKTFLTVKVNKDKSDAEKLKSSLRAVIVMVPVLGLTWAFGFLLLVDPLNKFFQYVFVILNSLQGVTVFLLHLVLNEDVRNALLKRRNRVAASTENTIFTKLPRNKNSEHSGMTTDTSKAPLPSDSTTM